MMRGGRLFLEVDGTVRAGRDAQPVEVAAGMIDHGFPGNQPQGAMRADFDAFP